MKKDKYNKKVIEAYEADNKVKIERVLLSSVEDVVDFKKEFKFGFDYRLKKD